MAPVKAPRHVEELAFEKGRRHGGAVHLHEISASAGLSSESLADDFLQCGSPVIRRLYCP